MSGAAIDYRELAARAESLEEMLRDIYTILTAVDLGDLLIATGNDPELNRRFSVGLGLLDIATRKVTEFCDLPGVDLSVCLSRLADGKAGPVT